jgi:hypothetical protein
LGGRLPFRTGGPRLPEVVVRPEALDVRLLDADVVAPDPVRLIVLLVHADPHLVGRQAQDLRHRGSTAPFLGFRV